MTPPRRTLRWFSRILLLLALVIASPGPPLFSFSSAMPAPSSEEEIVAFNTKSLKFHCKTCQWAKKCTVNCVDVPKSEALRRGGIPCKVCGGTCRR